MAAASAGRKAWRAGSLAAALAAAMGWADGARSAPITFHTALTVGEADLVFREQSAPDRSNNERVRPDRGVIGDRRTADQGTEEKPWQRTERLRDADGR